MTAAEIAHALGGRRSGLSFMCRCPAHDDSTPSLSITDGDRTPLLKCFAGCDSLDVIDALRGLGLWDAVRPSPSRKITPRKIERPDDDADRQSRIDAARRIWQGAREPRGTLAEKYLNARKLDLPRDLCERVLRFHPACPWGKGETVPALVAAFHPITEPDDAAPPVAIQRIGLKADGTKIAKKMLGPVAGCAIKLDADEIVSHGLGIAEGLETALAVRATGWRPMWALGSAIAIENFPTLNGIEALTIFADHDESGTGLTAARACAKRWADAGLEAFIRTPSEVGADWADVP